MFIVGGQNNATGDTVAYTSLVDPVADTIAAGPDVPNRAGGIADHQMMRFGRYVGVFGGEQQVNGTDAELDYAALFDSQTDSWYDVDSMIHVHDDFVAVPLGGYSVRLVTKAAAGSPRWRRRSGNVPPRAGMSEDHDRLESVKAIRWKRGRTACTR